VGLNLASINTIAVPYRCVTCRSRNDYDVAVKFYESGDWKDGLVARRAKFLTEEAVTRNPQLLEEQETDDDYDELDRTAFYEQSNETSLNNDDALQRQKNEMMKLMDAFNAMAKEKEAMKMQMENMAKQVEELKSKETGKGLGAIPKHSFCTNPDLPSSTIISEKTPPNVITMDNLMRLYAPRVSRVENNGNVNAKNGNFADATSVNGNVSHDSSTMDVLTQILMNQTQSQASVERSQIDILHKQYRTEIRKALPSINKYAGEPAKFVAFKEEVERLRTQGEYDDSLMKLFVLKALDGLPRERIRSVVDNLTFDELMKTLQSEFGKPKRVIEGCKEDIRAIKINKEMYFEDAMIILTKIQAYKRACTFAGVEVQNSNELAHHIVDMFEKHHREKYMSYLKKKYPDEQNKLMDLESLHSFLDNLKDRLEDKKVDKRDEKKINAQVLVTHVTENSKTTRDFLFDIRDSQHAKFMGYDLKKVNALQKICLCCESDDHFAVECNIYKGMDEIDRYKFVKNNKLCSACILTDKHTAFECELKTQCGWILNKEKRIRCDEKHHISLHNIISLLHNTKYDSNRHASYKKNNTNKNTARANEILMKNDPQNQVDASSQEIKDKESMVSQALKNAPPISALPRNLNTISVHQLLSVNVPKFNRTIKVFNINVLGKDKNENIHCVGDSGSEITLMSDQLREKLNIAGESCEIKLNWTDNSSKLVSAKKFDLTIRGNLNESETFTLQNCYSFKDFDLPPRSLNVERLKKAFPYLNKVECKSYWNVKPLLLIGSPHAACIESIDKLLENGIGKPVGLKTKLGFTIYGGDPNNKHDESQLQLSISEKNINESSKPLTNNGISSFHRFAPFFPRKHAISRALLKNKSWENVNDRQIPTISKNLHDANRKMINAIQFERRESKGILQLGFGSRQSRFLSESINLLRTENNPKSRNSIVTFARDKKFCPKISALASLARLIT
jgi:hypothetical protein